MEDGKCRKGDQLGADRQMRVVFVVSGIQDETTGAIHEQAALGHLGPQQHHVVLGMRGLGEPVWSLWWGSILRPELCCLF